MKAVASWGRLGAHPHRVVALGDPAHVPAEVSSTAPGLPFGLGRSYGDACLNPGGTLWSTQSLDHFVAFDVATGRLTCEAGVTLQAIQRAVLPHGWSLPVVPGTQLVTVGGAVANDVHGKNHHVCGSFGDHVLALTLQRTDGVARECGPAVEADWFEATVGGVGLTGLVVRATLQLRRCAGPWLDTETVPFAGIDECFSLSDDSESAWEHTVAWIDCLSPGTRGIFLRAQEARDQSGEWPVAPSRRMPFTPPVSLVNRATLAGLNAAYFARQKLARGPGRHLAEAFLFPLDGVADWNRAYGPRGFYQYQCVVPTAVRADAMGALLAEIRRAGTGSFLAVLKTFGARASRGMLGFPMPGATLALDFPNEGERTLQLFERLDAIVAAAGGRLYLAKDARMPRSLFELGYPRREEFLAYRDPGITSAMSRRLFGS